MKKVSLIVLLVGILLTLFAFSEAFSAGTFTAFGPRAFSRTTGKPTTATENFSVLNPNTSYTLHIYNGGKNNQFKGKVSSAIISLNSTEVVSPNEFNQNVSHIQKPITLLKDNKLAVDLRSKPDSGLTIEIIGVDNDAPKIVATSDPSPNAAGWNNTDVTVSFACSDTTSGIASCSGPVLVQQEGGNQVITGTASDNAGNMASTSITVKLDKTSPAIAKVLTPAPNAAGWNKTNVSVSFVCSDTISGIASCTSPVQMVNEGVNQIVSGTAVDIAGNTASISVAVNIDKTPPLVTIVSPLSGVVLQDPSVIVQGAINETLSGVNSVTCNGTPANLSGASFACNVSLVTGENILEAAATDLAGNAGYSSITVAFLPPALELAYVDEFELVWWDKGTGGTFDGAYYRPVVPSGFYCLGHYGQGDYGIPRGFVFAAKELELGALASPVDYTIVWDSGGCGASFWKPIPPPGYVCLGLVAQTWYSKPSTDAVRCVRQDLTVPAKVGNTIWIDEATSQCGVGWNVDFGSWQIIPADEHGIFIGTFTGNNSHSTPPSDPLFTIDARRVKRYEPGSDDIAWFVQQYGPELWFSESGNMAPIYPEEYLLDTPEYVLDYGTMLEWGLVQNETDYNSFSLDILGFVNTPAAGLMQDVASFVETSPSFGDPWFRQYLRIDDSVRPGSLDRAQALVRVRPWNWLSTELQFWLFYPFNGPGRVEVCASGTWCETTYLVEAGRHYGDWEHVTLRVDNRTKELISVYMSRHDEGQWVSRSCFSQVMGFNGTHPRIYVAYYSHAHYPTAGIHDYKRIWQKDYLFGTASADLRDIALGTGPVFSSSLPDKYRIISSALPGYQVAEPEWLQFQGRWGQYERLSDTFEFPGTSIPVYPYEEVGSGPTGPAMKSSWVRGDSGDNWWWTRYLEGKEACFDGIDNDGDGKIDCLDPDCKVTDPVCIHECLNSGLVCGWRRSESGCW